jgi:DNA-binding IclR family transcriptional regulator
LKAGGKWKVEEISEETEFANRTVQGHLRYGVELGFIERSDEGYSPTQRGYDLGFEPELNDTTEEQFLQGVLSSVVYVL